MGVNIAPKSKTILGILDFGAFCACLSVALPRTTRCPSAMPSIVIGKAPTRQGDQRGALNGLKHV